MKQFKGPQKQGIALKKRFGQHFLQDPLFIERMISAIDFSTPQCVFEIGCGQGALTDELMKQNVAKLWVFEIDEEWANVVNKKHKADKRFAMHTINILDADFTPFYVDKNWKLLANLPYNITFPILHLVQRNRQVISEGVVMVQEEVAQKIVKTHGRGYGYSSLFFQHYFEWKLMDKIPPQAFYPAPKVYSRLLYFKTKTVVPDIPDEERFWKFIKQCFLQPRRTLKNNLGQSHYDQEKLGEVLLAKRAQELSMQDFLHIWQVIK